LCYLGDVADIRCSALKWQLQLSGNIIEELVKLSFVAAGKSVQ
jgi:hypothetical protein